MDKPVDRRVCEINLGWGLGGGGALTDINSGECKYSCSSLLELLSLNILELNNTFQNNFILKKKKKKAVKIIDNLEA